MMGFFGFGFWMMGMWVFFLIIAVLVYQDAEYRGRTDGLLWFILLLIPMVSVFALILYLIVRDQDTGIHNQGSDPLAVVDQRYARGEIDQEEYRRIKADLRHR
jgi:putative membrane protein